MNSGATLLSHELSAAESMARSRDRKKRRMDAKLMVPRRQSLPLIYQYINSPTCPNLVKCLFRKMLSVGLLDDYTNPMVVRCLVDHTPVLLAAAPSCCDGNGLDLIRQSIDFSRYQHVGDVFRANYSSISDPEDKCIFWTIAAAFMIMCFEVQHDAIFTVPFKYSTEDFEPFLRRYPEFLIRTWDAVELLCFQLCMKTAVECFGNGNNMGCLVELVTRITKGRQVALTCNTSGGGLRNYDHPTEVSTEKCRILIYQRESGIVPRTRKSRGIKKRIFQASDSLSVREYEMFDARGMMGNSGIPMGMVHHHGGMNLPPHQGGYSLYPQDIMYNSHMYHQPIGYESGYDGGYGGAHAAYSELNDIVMYDPRQTRDSYGPPMTMEQYMRPSQMMPSPNYEMDPCYMYGPPSSAQVVSRNSSYAYGR